MKKVKIMLMSIALLAIVGGALAFKAKFNTKFCTTITIADGSGGWTCPTGDQVCADLTPYTFINNGKTPTTYCYTFLPAGQSDCSGVKDCLTYQTLRKDI